MRRQLMTWNQVTEHVNKQKLSPGGTVPDVHYSVYIRKQHTGDRHSRLVN